MFLNSYIQTVEEQKRENIPVPKLVVKLMIERFAEEISLDEIAEEIGKSKFFICRSFSREYQITPIRWLWLFRAIIASEFIKIAPLWSLTDIAFSCGFTSSAHFTRFFRQTFKATPSEFRDKLRESKNVQNTSNKNTYNALFESNQEIITAAANEAFKRVANSI